MHAILDLVGLAQACDHRDSLSEIQRPICPPQGKSRLECCPVVLVDAHPMYRHVLSERRCGKILLKLQVKQTSIWTLPMKFSLVIKKRMLIIMTSMLEFM